MQSFTPGAPVLNSLAVSQSVRDNFSSLLDNHAGAALPAYAVEGMVWFDSVNKRHYAVKARGTKPYTVAPMGPDITCFVSMLANGLNGSGVISDIRIRDNTLMGTETDWTNAFGQRLWFSTTKLPSYFAAKWWNDPLINDPILTSADGKLLGKTWEVLAPGVHEMVYSTGFFADEEPTYGAGTLRAVSIEADDTTWEGDFTLPGGIDHFTTAIGGFAWHDVQEYGGKITLLQDGYEVDPANYIVRFFCVGTVVWAAVYCVDPLAVDLAAFNAVSRYTLRIRKPS
jgi:hypothetical protein